MTRLTDPTAHHATRRRTRWLPLVWVVPVAVALLAAVVLLAIWLRGQAPVQEFIARYPGTTPLPEGAPVGIPAWLGWQHFLNGFFLVLLVRSGLLLRKRGRPPARWVRGNDGLVRTKNPPWKIGIYLWLHYVVDALWVLNGIVFVVLLLVTGQWMRIVPTSGDIWPNAVSAALQYASLNWPVEHAWVNYNSLQVLTYFGIVFVVAPLAVITGLRLSSVWPQRAERLNTLYPASLARAVHYPVMLAFVAFVIVHVALVFATGALRNLDAMYASRDDASWLGFAIFAVSLVVLVAGWFAVRPEVLTPIARRTGTVSR
ncbi:cytochrome b/b6 domain-containing protein [Agromyces subbeticus]|uniref:cytochrome b/b6 domain-containing protein n=1 Tax=Agromyces subbeticus TaxID=293890 RepID=UPI0004014EDF